MWFIKLQKPVLTVAKPASLSCEAKDQPKSHRHNIWARFFRCLKSSRGTATAETAMMLVVVMVLVGFLLAIGTTGLKQLQLNEATRTIAREVMRGDDPALAIETAIALAGPNSSFEISYQGDFVVVKGQKQVGLNPNSSGFLSFNLNLSCTFRTKVEPHLVRQYGS